MQADFFQTTVLCPSHTDQIKVQVKLCILVQEKKTFDGVTNQ